jgi:hypothetical protein
MSGSPPLAESAIREQIDRYAPQNSYGAGVLTLADHSGGAMESTRLRRRFRRAALVLGSVAAVLVALACSGSNHVALADPQAGSQAFVFPFPGPLKGEIDSLDAAAKKENPPGPNAKKALILHSAFAALLPQPPAFTSKATIGGLAHTKDYAFNTSKQMSDPNFFPAYFSQPFNNNPVSVTAVPAGLYDYAPDKAGKLQLWVDFANHKLGGGVFGNGMVQEETMALSMPQLADAAALNYYTRTQGKEGVLNSDPTPLVLQNIQRSIKLDASLYRDGWKSQTVAQIDAHLTPQIPNQNLHVLAMAVEKLVPGTDEQKTDIRTIEDLFNTFVAGYTLAKETMNGTVINTGPIGTGDFNNDRKVVYVMQHLALQQIGGLTVNYWGLNDTDHKDYEDMLHKIMVQWHKDPDKKVLNLMIIAHNCFTGAKTCA